MKILSVRPPSSTQTQVCSLSPGSFINTSLYVFGPHDRQHMANAITPVFLRYALLVCIRCTANIAGHSKKARLCLLQNAY